MLGQLGVNPAAEDNRALRLAAQCGHLEVVRLLSEHLGTDATVYNSATQSATRRGHLEIVKLLLKYSGVHLTSYDDYTITVAVKNRRPEMIKLLSENLNSHL